MVLEKQKLASLQDNRTKRLSDIVLDNGESLVEYHHQLHQMLGNTARSTVDLSRFYGQFGSAAQYYTAYLSLFLAHAVLFEDYHGGEEAGVDLDDFTERIYMPAHQELKHIFGVTPLLVHMPWHDNFKYYAPPNVMECTMSKVLPSELLLYRPQA